ncbi:unnamed protein product [Fusarium graminearum]|nr:unnamed protein product [Fusarium graminearum]
MLKPALRSLLLLVEIQGFLGFLNQFASLTDDAFERTVQPRGQVQVSVGIESLGVVVKQSRHHLQLCELARQRSQV